MQELLNVSVLEQNLLSDKAVAGHTPPRKDGHGNKRPQPDSRDIFRRVKSSSLCTFTRQLATLLHAGMPLVPALSALVEQLQSLPKSKLTRSPNRIDPLAQIVRQIADAVEAGSTLADALKEHPDVFSNLFINMVAAGEASGTLERILLRLAQMQEKRLNVTSKVKSAVVYPVMMVVVAVMVVAFLLSFVVPGITQIFLEMNRTLPWPTRLLIATSALTRTYFIIIAVGVCAICFGLAAACRNAEGKLFVDRLKLRLPLFGKLFVKLQIARLARTLGILLVSGIPILDALDIAKGVIQNSFVANALESVRDLVAKGENIAEAIRRTGLFPPIVFHIIAAGQISGDIETGLINVADMYDTEVEASAKTLVTLIEPTVLLIMGAVIGFIVLAILLPIFEISQAF